MSSEPQPPPGPPRSEPPASLVSLAETQKMLAKRATLSAAFGFAIAGVLRTLCTQRNMKIHWVSGLAVMLVGMAIDLDIAARASVMFCVAVVLCMEILNTAFEAFVDLHIRQYARTAMIAKDAAAAAVLVLAVGSVVVFADILVHRWAVIMASGPAIVRTLLAGVPLLGLMSAILSIRRRLPLLTVLGAMSIALIAFLAYSSRDEVFSLGALGFVSCGLWARVREPELTG
jgi:diacylglycerol kinase (ATP)